jgi:hypothetical protein
VNIGGRTRGCDLFFVAVLISPLYCIYRYKRSFLKNVNNFENFLIKYLEIKIKALPLHPQSGSNNATECDQRFLEIFLKKVTKKFGGFKNMIYLCTAFPP